MIELILSLVIAVISVITPAKAEAPVVIIPAMPNYAPAMSKEESEWSEFHLDAFLEYEDEFTALFNSYEVKRAKNGAMMIRRGSSGPYKFARKG